jgi:hypothetical protein
MISFKTFLEAQIKPYDVHHLEMEALIKELKANCKDSLKPEKEVEIWRGTKKSSKSGIYHPGSGERTSANTQNFYTLLIDSNPLNKDYPKRSKSFICSTRRGGAESYAYSDGGLFRIFPFDSTKIGAVNKEDFWNLRPKLDIESHWANAHIESLNSFWERIYRSFEIDAKSSMDEVISALKKAPIETYRTISISYQDEVDAFIESIPKAYSLKELGCDVGTVSQLNFHDEIKGELWFSEKCIMVNMKDFSTIKEEFKL